MPKQIKPSLDVIRMLAELRKSFMDDLPSRLEEIETIILDLGNGIDFTENFETLYRHIHSIKGSAGTQGLHILSTICHSFEDEIVKVEGDESSINGTVITSWLSFVDLLRTTLDSIKSGVTDFSDVDAALDQFKHKEGEPKYFGLLAFSAGVQQNMCLSVFENSPVHIAFSDNGYEAMGRLLHEKFDFVISNMELPDLNGLALISALRLSKTRNYNIPSVLLTSKKLNLQGVDSEPNYIIQKDSAMLKNISSAATEIISLLETE